MLVRGVLPSAVGPDTAFYLASPTTCGTLRCARRCNSDLVSGPGRRLRRSSSPRKVRISTRSFCLSLGLFNFSAFVPNAKPFKARSSPKRTSWPAELGLPASRIHPQWLKPLRWSLPSVRRSSLPSSVDRHIRITVSDCTDLPAHTISMLRSAQIYFG